MPNDEIRLPITYNQVGSRVRSEREGMEHKNPSAGSLYMALIPAVTDGAKGDIYAILAQTATSTAQPYQ